MSIKTIHDTLLAGGMTEEGVCGMMGNMRGESAMRSNNAQDAFEIDDAAYTTQADNGLNNFTGDSIGYGLCQWTKASRKAKLLAYAKMQGVSVGDEDMQVRFCLLELMNDFPSVWAVLTNSHDLAGCTEIVLTVYENPEIKNFDDRYTYAREFRDYFASAAADVPTMDTTPAPGYPWKPDLAVMLLQTLMKHDGFWDDEIDGYKSEEFRDLIVDYAKAVAEC